MFKSFFKILMMAMFIGIMEDEGGGAYADDGGDNNPNPPAAAEPANTVTMTREELQELVSPMQEYAQEKAVNAATTDIQSRIADFDLSKVHAHLQELNKTNPSQAASLNNPQGWELLWMRELAGKSVSADAVNTGRNIDSDGGRQALIDKVARGEGSRFDAENLLLKHL